MAIEPETQVEREFETQDLFVNIGPQHPATHGVFRMVLEVDGEVVRNLIPHIGYMHRGGEKLSEHMDYRQAIGYQDRTEYLSQFNAELCYVLAVEKLAGLVPPERAEYIRIILTELNRVSSHFMFLGAFGTDLGVFGTSFTYAFREREHILDLFEEVSGDRLMYAYFRPGGVAWDVPRDFKDRVRWVCKQALVGADDMDKLLTDNEIFIARTRNIGKLSIEDAIDYGVTGPMLRASGMKFDLRRDEPYSIYDRFDFDIPVGTNGDCYDRYLVRLQEIRESIRIVEQAVEQMPDEGPILPERMPRMLRPAAGEVYMRCEDPRGEYGVYIISKGATQPYRCRIRSPSFCNLSALKHMTVGHFVADAVTILGATDIVLCSVDR
ncbi:MAG TPA: NADH-quinone oxidoreductase subunit D [Dehalococcoidia bacterium]|nr:NADH-quinone oxidoreductase subunit D [Dehalococcoidia bacterium]